MVPSRSTERYTEEQLVEILKRAAQRQEGLVTEPDGRFSLEEIQQIASEVGIAPSHVATAAAEVATAPPPTSGALGVPTVFRFERWIDGEVSRGTIGDLVDLARRETGIQGTVTEALDSVEWRGKGQVDSTIVSITPRDGRTKITVALTRSESAALAVTGGSMAGLVGAMAIGSSLVAAAQPWGGLAVTAAVLASIGWGGGGAWLVTRAVWRRLARKWPGSAAALGTELVEAAQHAVDGARKDSE
ncbi:MAG TPA: hypothetical protein VFZ21_32445 [Gemmatimonadaceae bacterium]|nr:hypothetical protein [Gemmatimonadaceae bacterium]